MQEDDSVAAALAFIPFAFKGPECGYEGTTVFVVTCGEGTVIERTVVVKDGEVAVRDGVCGQEEGPVVRVSSSTLVGLLGGKVDPMVAMMSGEVIVNDLEGLLAFAQAFHFDGDHFSQFQASLEEDDAVPTPLAPPTAPPAEPQTTSVPLLASARLMHAQIESWVGSNAYTNAFHSLIEIGDRIAASPAMQHVQSAVATYAQQLRMERRAQMATELAMEAGRRVASAVRDLTATETDEERVARQRDRRRERVALEAELERLQEENRRYAQERERRMREEEGLMTYDELELSLQPERDLPPL